MTDSIRLADHIWKDGGWLVDRLDQLGRSDTQPSVIYREVAEGLITATGCVCCEVYVVDGGKKVPLASAGGVDFSRPNEPNENGTAQQPHGGHTALATWATPTLLIATQPLDSRSSLRIVTEFRQPSEPKAAQALRELSEAVLQIASAIYLRQSYGDFRGNVAAAVSDSGRVQDQLQWVSRLHAGATLQESFATIADSVAQVATIDRVCLLQKTRSGYQLVASSTQPSIDRRAQQVRLLETLVAVRLHADDAFQFTVGESDHRSGIDATNLEAYLTAAGSRSVYMEVVPEHGEKTKAIAAIFLEQFDADTKEGLSSYTQKREVIHQAIRNAIAREDVNSRRLIGGRLRVLLGSHKLAWAITLAAGIIAALAIIPAELKLAVDGRVIPRQQNRVYAPVDSTVAAISIQDGQAVQKGEPLVRLQSDQLDRTRQQLEGDLATAQTQLSVLSTSRSSDSRQSDPRLREVGDAKVLQARIAGLNRQLELIRDQQDSLSLVSPIDGVVDRWDLRDSMELKPVRHGEYLLSVHAPDQGWLVELDVPEHESAYVIEQQRISPCHCVVRLRSSDEIEFAATLDRVSLVADVGQSGRMVVPATLTVDRGYDASMRPGASVKAWVYCGKRSLGFVWFRKVIQWTREQGWL